MTISITAKDQDTFSVTVTGSSTTTHTVTISDQVHTKLTDGKISKETLLEKSFEFLLQREPNTSILAKFKLEVISQYFPDYAKQASTWQQQTERIKHYVHHSRNRHDALSGCSHERAGSVYVY